MEKIKLEQVFAIRHGSAESDGLTPAGMTEVGRLAARLSELIPFDKSVLVLTSIEPKTKQSAAILKGVLGFKRRLDWDFYQIFENDQYDGSRQAADKLSCLAEKDKFQVVVAVTHGWLASGIANVFAGTFGGEVKPTHPDEGNGFMIDLMERKILADLFSMD